MPDNTPQHPGNLLRQLLEQKGWTQDEFATITGRRRATITDILSGKSGISPEMAITFSAAFGNSPEEWLKWDSQYRLALAETDASEIERRARLYQMAPIRDMQKREWIKDTPDLNELETEFKSFFGRDNLEDNLTFPVAAKRTVELPSLNIAERAWCFRARQLASTIVAARFSSHRLPSCAKQLRQLAAYPKEARHLHVLLAEYGIRFVVIEPLPNAKIDGAAFWLETGPVIAVSLRYDRNDGFWFTVMHEFIHICNEDAISVDTDLIDGIKGLTVMLANDEAEQKANEGAAAALIPREEMDSFIRRVGPLYSRERVIQFAHRIKIHPGIVVGQLQYRNEIGYSALRNLLVKIRDVVIGTALTDGWNKTITPGLV
jgi:HTH-type transcriptional regulator / antitoxin HigA